jgi:hypothetical protein
MTARFRHFPWRAVTFAVPLEASPAFWKSQRAVVSFFEPPSASLPRRYLHRAAGR